MGPKPGDCEAGQDHGAGPQETSDEIFQSVRTGDDGGQGTGRRAGTRWKGSKTPSTGKRACPDRGNGMLTPWNAPQIPQTPLGTFPPQNPKSIPSKCLHRIEYNEAHFSVCPNQDT